jgi:iron complex transport system ATP-binding protein
MADPELLLLDEPAAGLDLGGREDLLKRFTIFASDPNAPATILVTHHIEEIPSGTTHALILKNGTVAVSGPIADVITSEHMSNIFELPMEVRFDGYRFSARAL